MVLDGTISGLNPELMPQQMGTQYRTAGIPNYPALTFPYTPREPLSTQQHQQSAAKDTPGFLSGNLQAGWAETKGLLWGGLGLAADYASTFATDMAEKRFGTEGYDVFADVEDFLNTWAEKGFSNYQSSMAEAEKIMPRQVGRIEDIKGLSDFGIWAGETILRQAPVLATSLGSGLIGSTIAKTAMGTAVRNAAKTNLASLVAKGVPADAAAAEIAKQTALAMSSLATKGAYTGTFLATTAMEGGGNWADTIGKYGYQYNPGQDLVFGALSAASELILGMEGSFIRQLTGKTVSKAAEMSFRKELIKAIGKHGFQEGSQEGLQEILSIINSKLHDGVGGDFTKDDVMTALNSIAAGTLMGGMFGAGNGLSQRGKQRAATDSPTDIADAAKANTTPYESSVNTGTTAPDVSAIAAKVERQLNPVYAVEQEEREIYDAITTRTANAIQTTQESYAKRFEQLAKEANKVEADLAKWKDIRDPDAGLLQQQSPEGYKKKIQELEKKQMSMIAKRAALVEAEKQAVDYARKAEEKEIKSSYGRLLDADRMSAISRVDAIRKNNANNEERVIKLTDTIEDVQAYTNRMNSTLDTTVEEINATLERLSTELNYVSGTDVAADIQTQIYALEKAKLKIANSKQAIHKQASSIIEEAVNNRDADLVNIDNQMQKLFAMGNTEKADTSMYVTKILKENKSKTAEEAYIKDLVARGLLQEARAHVDNLSNEKNKAKSLALSAAIAEAEMEFIEQQRQEAQQRQAEVLAELEEKQEINTAIRAQQEHMDAINLAKQQYQQLNAPKAPALIAGTQLAQQQKTPEAQKAVMQQTQELVEQDVNDSLQPPSQVSAQIDGTTTVEVEQTPAVQQQEKEMATNGYHQVARPTLQMYAASQSEKVSEVLGWLEAVFKHLPALRDIVYVSDTLATDPGVPEHVRYAASKNDKISGAISNGFIYINSAAIKDKNTALKVLIHEAIGHGGIKNIFSDAQIGALTKTLQKSFGSTQIWKDLEVRYKTTNPVIIGQEYLAYIAEQNTIKDLLKRSSVWGTIKVLFKSALAKLGLTKLTDNDVLSLLAASAKYIQKSKRVVASIGTTQELTRRSVSNQLGTGVQTTTLAEASYMYNTLMNALSGVPGVAYHNEALTDNDFIPMGASLKDLYQSYTKQRLYDKARSIKNLLGREPHSDDGTIMHIIGALQANGATPNSIAKAMLQAGIKGVQKEDIVGKTYWTYSTAELGIDNPALEAPTMQQQYDTDTLFSITDAEDTHYAQSYYETRKRELAENNKWQRIKKEINSIGRVSSKDGALPVHHGWFERAVEYLYDPNRRLQVVQRFIKEKYKDTAKKNVINMYTNVYKHMLGMSNRIHRAQLDFWNLDVIPIVDKLKELDISPIEKNDPTNVDLKIAILDDYIRARHAPEVNAYLNSKKKGVPMPAPSGLTNQEAFNKLKQLESITGLEEIADMVSALNEKRLDVLLENKIITKESYDAMKATYQYYVPLKNWDEFMQDLGVDYMQNRSRAGLSIGTKNPTPYRTGRGTELPQSPTTMSILQLMDSVAISEKTQAGRVFLNLVQEVDDKNLWEISDKFKVVYEQKDNGDGTFSIVEKEVRGKRIQRDKKGNIVTRNRAHLLEGSGLSFVNILNENGEIIHIAIRDEALAKALRTENMTNNGAIVDFIKKCTRRFIMLATNNNPAFILPNNVRDLGTALLNLGNVLAENQKLNLISSQGKISAKIAGEVLSGRVHKFLWKVLNNKIDINDPNLSEADKQDFHLYNKFKGHGGHTRMYEAKDFASTYTMLRNAIRKKSAPMKLVEGYLNITDMMSDISENSTRFAVFKHMYLGFMEQAKAQQKEQGLPKEWLVEQEQLAASKASNIALEITVNFTRKGTGAPFFNSLFAFSSAAIAGNVRVFQNLWRRGDTTAQNVARVGKFLISGIVGAMMLSMFNRSMMGDDDDGVNKYDKIPTYVKNMNIVIASPFSDGGYLKIPFPHVYNLFLAIGNAIDSVAHGRKKPSSGVAEIVSTMFDNFNPIGNSSEGFTALVPTVFRPIAQIATNKTFTGAPIVPEPGAYKGYVPDSQKFWSTSPYAYRVVAEYFNAFTGGSKTESGFIDVSPETIEHLITSYGSGVGQLITGTLKLLASPITGEETPVSRMPIVSRFVGNVGYQNTVVEFSQVRTAIQTGINMSKMARDDETLSPEQRRMMLSEASSALQLQKIFNRVTTKINGIRKLENDIKARGTLTPEISARLKNYEKQKEELMKLLIKQARIAGLQYEEAQ